MLQEAQLATSQVVFTQLPQLVKVYPVLQIEQKLSNEHCPQFETPQAKALVLTLVTQYPLTDMDVTGCA